MPADRPLDLAIIGAGIAGVIHLHHARQAGLDAVALEARPGIGGLWRELPAWQDIQISTADWAIGDLPLAGPLAPQIVDNIQAWVDRFALADGIRLDSPVHRARHVGDAWELHTPQGLVRARHLVAASGGHNTPLIPPVRRTGSRVREWHASALHAPAALAGREVMVVGGGASAFDLIDQCLEHGAGRLMWVYRGVRWFTPTTRPKAIAGSVRPFAKMQASGMSAAQQNAAIGTDMLARYQKFGIQAIQPDHPPDVLHDQLIPGRPRMLTQFGRIERYAGTVEAIEGTRVALSDGTRLNADLILWGTGYATDLRYFEDPRLASIRSVNQLGARCGCIFRSLDAPNLYFPGVGLDGIGAAPWAYMLIARSIVSHIRGTARLDMATADHKINHFEIVRHLADRDPGSYPEGRGWEYYRAIALNTPDDQPYPLL
ncbi:MAG TPA: NAD(P)-binding domain-containing protein [Rubrivivax sp.]|nr:NAD(P)-binding domain-containing protein [Rubrivivax sp.]